MSSGINFNLLNARNPSEGSFTRGVQTGTALRATRENIDASQQKRARLAEMQTDLGALSNNQNATTQDYSRLMIKYPEVGADIKRGFDTLNADQQQNKLEQASQVYSALETGDKETAIKLLTKQKEAALASGLEEEANKADIILKQVEMNPDAAKTALRLSLSTIMGPEKFASAFKSLTEAGEQFKVLNAEDKEKLKLDPKQSFQMSSDGKISPISSAGVIVNVQRDAPPAGFRYIFNENGQVESMEVIPGSKAERDLKAEVKKEKLTKVRELKKGELFIQKAEKVKTMIRDAPWFAPVVGVASQKIFPTFRQNVVDVNELVESLRAQLGFAQLTALKAASPTGGALGPVSDKENELLQKSVQSIDTSQSEEQIIDNFNKLILDFSQVVHGDKYLYHRGKSEVKKIESQLNRVLTDEEVQSLINEELI